LGDAGNVVARDVDQSAVGPEAGGEDAVALIRDRVAFNFAARQWDGGARDRAGDGRKEEEGLSVQYFERVR
jgi:hypothetical protein